jgi:hypothetical protein
MQQMTFGECVKRTWTSAREAATEMPLLMLGAFAVYMALSFMAGAGRYRPGVGEPPSGGLAFAGAIASLLNLVVYLGFVIKIQRFVLLREGITPLVPLGGKPLARMFGLGFVIGLAIVASAILLVVVLRPHHAGGITFITVLVVALWIFVGVRLSLLFPSISTGGRIDLRGAWHDTSGHFWGLVGVQFVTVLPLVACTIVGTIIAMAAVRAAGLTPAAALASPAWILLLAAGQGLGKTAFVLITSSSHAWLFRRYANKLSAPLEG